MTPIPSESADPIETGDQLTPSESPDQYGDQPVASPSDSFGVHPGQLPPGDHCNAGIGYYIVRNYPNDFVVHWQDSVINHTRDNITQTLTDDVTKSLSVQIGVSASADLKVSLLGKVHAEVNAQVIYTRSTNRGDQITVTTRPSQTTTVKRGVNREKVRFRKVYWHSNCMHQFVEFDFNAPYTAAWLARST